MTFDRLLSPSTVSRGSFRLTTGSVGVFVGTTYDPARRRVVLGLNPGDLRPGLEYVLTVTDAVRGWDGSSLASPYVVRFRAGERVTVDRPDAPTLGAVAALFSRRCVDAGCHVGPTPAMGLDLSSAAAIRRTALGAPSVERPGPVSGNTDPRWGALLRVDPGVAGGVGQPGYSYLLYKILGDGPMLGERMPRGAPPLSDDEVALVSDWIAAGARAP